MKNILTKDTPPRIGGRPTYRKRHDENDFSQSPHLERKSRHQSASRKECSDKDDSESDTEHVSNSPTRKSRKEKFNLEISSDSPKLRNSFTTPTKVNNCSKTSNPGFIRSISIALVVIFVACILVASGYLNKTEVDPEYKNCSFDTLQQKYPSEDNILWKSLKIGIERILNHEQPSPAIYLILHNGKSSSKELITQIAQRASECFDPNQKPIVISANDFSSEEANDDYGVIVKLYKERIKEGSVTIIANLNEIPAEAARALHSICDTYSPIVHKAVVFLTLVPNSNEGKPIVIAEKTLNDLWSTKLTDYELEPLITRVTDQVLQINLS